MLRSPLLATFHFNSCSSGSEIYFMSALLLRSQFCRFTSVFLLQCFVSVTHFNSISKCVNKIYRNFCLYD